MYHCLQCKYNYAQAVEHPTLGAICPVCSEPVYTKAQYAKLIRKRKRRCRIRRKDASLARIAERDGYICQLCNQPVDMQSQDGYMRPSRDHIQSLSQGGTNLPENLQLTHQICNTRKGDQEQKLRLQKCRLEELEDSPGSDPGVSRFEP